MNAARALWRHDRADRSPPLDDDRALAVRVGLEVRHARLRLAIAENELAFAAVLLGAGDITPDAALAILDDTMNDIAGVTP